MPRDLADVLHYFLPEEGDAKSADESIVARKATDSVPCGAPGTQRSPDRAMSVIGVPIGDRHVVRAALTWNLAVETARLGNRAVVLAPSPKVQTPLWPEAGVGPLGTEVVFCTATDLSELSERAIELSMTPAISSLRGPGSVFVRVPPEWLLTEAAAPAVIPWWLLMSSPNRQDLARAHELASAIRRAAPTPIVGITIHGVSHISEAKRAYEHLARRCAAELGLDLRSYGLLVDDLHVYRAIAAQRPIGLAHPQAPATRALIDVARLLVEDAESIGDG